MKLRNKFLTIAFAMFLLGVGFVYESSAQTRRVIVRRPVVVRNYVYRNPYLYSRYYYDPFYDPYYYSPYLRYQDQKYRLQSELAGNRRELSEHLQKYRADGVITAKEQRELDDDYRDVARATRELRSFTRDYEVRY
jgi:hypothetical protein